jgi:hypothetical protein
MVAGAAFLQNILMENMALFGVRMRLRLILSVGYQE